MIDALARWAAMVGILLAGVHAYDGSSIRRSERACRCYCGMVEGTRQDLPPPEAGERWRYRRWFGDTAIVCFVTPNPDAPVRLQQIQEYAHAAQLQRWISEGRPR